MRKKILIIILVVTLLTSGIFASAYFYNKLNGASHSITSNLDNSSIIEIDSFDEFLKEAYQYTSNSDEYNSEIKYSDTSSRKTLKLTTNIVLKNDVLINRDCHINLNGKTIDLNGFDLNVKNQYAGTFGLYNGTIIDSSTFSEGEDVVYGKVIIDCPNAAYEFNDLIYDENIVDIVEVSEQEVCLAAFEFMYANITNTGINNFYDSKYTESTLKSCELCEQENSVYCVYTYTDLDLIFNYFSYDITIDYSSVDETILTSKGRVIVADETQTTILTVNITFGETTVSRSINVHVVSEEDYVKAAASVMIKYLEKYYIDGEFKFGNSLVLPIVNDYFNCDYLYTLSNGITSSTSNDYFDLNTISGFALVSINSDITSFTITSSDKDDGQNTYTSNALPVAGEASSNIDDNHSYALGVLSSLYGNQINIQTGYASSTGYTEVALLTDPSLNGYTRLKSISYDLINNYENVYQVIDYEKDSTHYDLLNVITEENPPYLGQTVFLSAEFTFVDDSVITLQVPIVYVPKALGEAEGFDSFAPYHVYFNNQFVKATNNYTIDSFNIPLCYGNNYPVYVLQIYQINEDKTFTPVSTTEGLFKIDWSGDSNLSSFEADTTTNITIDPYYISQETKSYYFVYIPVNKDGSGKTIYWQEDNTWDEDLTKITIKDIENYDYKSLLTVPGIVRYQCSKTIKDEDENYITEAFADKDLYALAYEKLYNEEYNGQFIYTSMLSRKIDIIDFSSASTSYSVVLSDAEIDNDAADEGTNKVISSLRGINLLTGVIELTFEETPLYVGTNFTSEMGYISEMTNLEILNLNSTGIYDSVEGQTGFAEGDSNQFLYILSSLTNLRELYLANNKIYSFADLDLFASLQIVDVTNNTFESKINIGDGTLAQWLENYINPTLTDVTNSINGSNGAVNVSVFNNLIAKGVKVTGNGSGGEVDEEIQLIIDALISLEYQDKLSKDIPISTIYNQYSTNYSTYGLYNSYDKKASRADVLFTFQYIDFESNDAQDEETKEYAGTYFKFKIVYKYSCTYLGETYSGNIEYTQNYRITRY